MNKYLNIENISDITSVEGPVFLIRKPYTAKLEKFTYLNIDEDFSVIEKSVEGRSVSLYETNGFVIKDKCFPVVEGVFIGNFIGPNEAPSGGVFLIKTDSNIELDGVFAAGNLYFYNYSHFLTQVLPSILVGYFFAKELNIKYFIVPVLRGWQWQLIDLLNLPRSMFFEKLPGQIVSSKRIYFTSAQFVGPHTECINNGSLHWLRDQIIKGSGITNLVRGSKIAVVRKYAKDRILRNSREIFDYLKNSGFKVVELEDLSVKEQVELFRGASIVVAEHGAGLTNCLFCLAETVIVELMPKGKVNSAYPFISHLFNLKHVRCYGGRIDSGGFWEIDFDWFKFNLNKISLH